ncbi:MAG: 3TM-type holin, partial [Halobacteriota archaeon]
MTDIGIIAVGGYNEMGRNMTAIRVDEDIIIVDMGLRLDRVQIHEDVEIDKMHSLELIEMGAIPDDTIMKQVNGNVAAIVCTHGHLDHIGAISKLAHRYTAPIIGTPYTSALVKQQIESEDHTETIARINQETAWITGQLDINKQAAQHKSLFVAGGRPAIIWICGAALGYQFLLYPLLCWTWKLLVATGHLPDGIEPPPTMSMSELMPILLGLLG